MTYLEQFGKLTFEGKTETSMFFSRIQNLSGSLLSACIHYEPVLLGQDTAGSWLDARLWPECCTDSDVSRRLSGTTA